MSDHDTQRDAGVPAEPSQRGLLVWLDDRRPPPDDGWRRVRTPAEAIALLRAGVVAVLSLDHDLGIFTGEREETGYDVLLWIEREVAAGAFAPPELLVHSSNPVGRRRMTQAIEAIGRLLERREPG
jgi:hypothetical protein